MIAKGCNELSPRFNQSTPPDQRLFFATTKPRMNDRRRTDQASHAHKRASDEDKFARLHKRIDDSEQIQTELIKAKFELFGLMKETNGALNSLAESQSELIVEMKKTVKLREFAEDVEGMMGLMVRLNNGIGVLWKPILFVAVLGGSIWLWIVGGKPPP